MLAIYGLVTYVDEASTHLPTELDNRWAEQTTWAEVGTSSSGPAVSLELGYRIDHLTALMFAMVTFVSTMIFIFSLGYMGGRDGGYSRRS